MQDLALKLVLEGYSSLITDATIYLVDTHHSGNLGHFRCTSADTKSKDNMVDVKHAILVSTLYSDFPLARVKLLYRKDFRGGPDVDLEGLRVELEPVCEL